MNPDTLCMGCMSDKGTDVICPHCKYQEEASRSPLVLPYRTILNEKFLVGKVLGKPGGFGITYLAWDMLLQTTAAIKEYLPREFAARDHDRTAVVPFSPEDTQTFTYGLGQFLQEAQTLITLNHPNVIRIREFFRANNTAYLVMDYCKGISLEEYLHRKGGKLPEPLALKIMLPILSGLMEVHRKGFLHRDIKPNNIYLTQENKVMLLDFGAARVAMGEQSKSLSVVLTPGFAPYEQYHSRGKQGPWTDIYACGATLYYLLTGIKPLDAIARYQHDDLVPPERLIPGVSASVNQAIMQALAVNAADRPQNIQEFYRRLASKNTSAAIPAPADDQTIPQFQTSPPQPQTSASAPIRLQKQSPTITPLTITKFCPHCGVENVLPKGTPLAEAICTSCRKPFGEQPKSAKKKPPIWAWLGIGAGVMIGVIVGGSMLWQNAKRANPTPPAIEIAPTPRPTAVIVPTAAPTSNAIPTPRQDAAVAPELPEEMPTPPNQPMPRPEAQEACQGKTQGDVCTFSTVARDQTLVGVCKFVKTGQFACVPQRRLSETQGQGRPPQDRPNQAGQSPGGPSQGSQDQNRPSQPGGMPPGGSSGGPPPGGPPPSGSPPPRP